MYVMKSLGWVVGLSVVAGGLMVTPAQAGPSSFSDITGTNIWNNVAPYSDSATPIDPNLINNVNRINQEAEQAFNACNAALAQIEQTAPTTRRFARQPGTQTVQVPVACRQLEQLRAEAATLRSTLEEAQRLRTGAAFATW